VSIVEFSLIARENAPGEAATSAKDTAAYQSHSREVRQAQFGAAIRRREIAAMVIDAANVISMANRSGVEHLRLFAPQGLIKIGQVLPDQVLRFVNGLREDLKRLVLENSSLVTLPNGMCLRGSMLDGNPSAMLVLFEPASRVDERKLSPRELEVATLVLNSLSNRDIAAKLCVAPNTVEGHLKRIFTKMQVRTRAGLVAKMLGWEAEGDEKNS
jgi:DNA-binding CsgD family transcriptional regulator